MAVRSWEPWFFLPAMFLGTVALPSPLFLVFVAGGKKLSSG